MTDCLFCKIIAKEIPSDIVYEDEHAFGFLDINPVNVGHVLVVPKKHYADFLSADPEALKELIVAAQNITKTFAPVLGVSGFNIVENNGADAGQVIPHVHFHLIPRKPGDGFEHWPGTKSPPGKDAEVAEKMREALK